MNDKITTETQRPIEYEKHIPDGETLTTITIKATAETKNGTKAVIESDYDAKDDIKELEWDETHRKWHGRRDLKGDVNNGAWLVDLDSVEAVVEYLVNNNHLVSVNTAILD